MTQGLWDTPTTEQLLLLQGVHASLVTEKRWPDVRYLGRWLRRASVDAEVRQVLDSFPVIGSRKSVGPSFSAVWFDPNNYSYDATVRLTLAAGLQLAEYAYFTDKYIELIRFCAKRVALANPNGGTVVVGSQSLYRKFGENYVFFVGSLPWVLEHEPFSLSGRLELLGDGWRLALNEVLAEYAGIGNLNDYVRKVVELIEREDAKAQPALLPVSSVGWRSPSGNAYGLSPSVKQQEQVGMNEEQVYDIAVSFAGEDRPYVAAVVEAAKVRGIKVFYDADKGNEWWGRSVIREQRRVYGSQARFFVPFISAAYLVKPFPMDEFETAMMTAVQHGDDYILPILIGSVQVPADLLHPQTRYLRAEDHTPEQMAEQLAERLGRALFSGQQPKDVAQVVQEAYELRMPKVVPDSFSKYQELQRVYDYLADRFHEAVAKLRSHGFVGTVHKSDTMLTVRIERRGDTVYALNINKGGSLGDDRLDFSYDTRRIGSGINGWAIPFFDKDVGQARLNVMDMSVFDSTGSTEGQLTKEELFIRLWDRVVARLEQS